jgi:hypothetical protein
MTQQTNPVTDIQAAMELLKASVGNMTPELKLEYDQMTASNWGNLSSDDKSKLHKLDVARQIAVLNVKGVKFLKAYLQYCKDTGDEISIRPPGMIREKDKNGEWVARFTSLPSKKADEVWLPGGKDLVFTFKGVRHVNTYIKEGEVKTSRGSKAACESLCKAIGKNTSGSTASTSIKRELEKLDSDGNPGGLSYFRTQLEECWIQHPSINGGKLQKLTEYFLALDGLDEATDEEEGNAEDESES